MYSREENLTFKDQEVFKKNLNACNYRMQFSVRYLYGCDHNEINGFIFLKMRFTFLFHILGEAIITFLMVLTKICLFLKISS